MDCQVNTMSAQRFQRLCLATPSGLRPACISSSTTNSALLRPQLHRQRLRTDSASHVRKNSTLATFKVPTVANEPNVSFYSSPIYLPCLTHRVATLCQRLGIKTEAHGSLCDAFSKSPCGRPHCHPRENGKVCLAAHSLSETVR